MVICKSIKKVILFTLCVVFWLMFCLQVNAQTETKVYNRGEEVLLTHDLFWYNEQYYIHINDLEKLNLTVTEQDNEFTITSNDGLGMERKLVIKTGDGNLEDDFILEIQPITVLSDETPAVKNVCREVSYTKRHTKKMGYTRNWNYYGDIEINIQKSGSVNDFTSIGAVKDITFDGVILNKYTDEMITVDGEYYIASQVAGRKLSHGYSENDGRIDFYIADSKGVLMDIMVSLVEITVAPSGGYNANVYTAYKTGEGDSVEDFEILSSLKCTIPENETNVNCLIETPSEKIRDNNIYIVVDFGERYALSYDVFDFSKVGTVNVFGRQKDVTYTVNLSLPEVEECDVPFAICARVLSKTYKANGIVKSGEKSATLELAGLPIDESYITWIEFDYHKYRNGYIDEYALFPNSAYVVDFKDNYTARYSKKVTCNVGLPDGFVPEGDVEVELRLPERVLSNGGMTYVGLIKEWTDEKTIVLNKDNPSQQIVLYADETSSMLVYELIDDVDGIYGKGYLGIDGKATSDKTASEEITEDSTVELKLLRKKNMKVNIARPADMSVDNNIYGNVQLSKSTTGYYTVENIDFTETPLIPSGEMSASFVFEMEEGRKYLLRIDEITGDDRLFNYHCYVDYPATGVETAAYRKITFDDESVDITLLKCNNVAGTILCEDEESNLEFTAVACCTLNNGEEVELTAMVEGCKFDIKIPEVTESYSLAVRTRAGKNSYYVSDGISTNNSGEATKILFEYGDDRTAELEYILQKPSAPIVFSYDESLRRIEFVNTSDYLVEADVFIVYYDNDGKMIRLERSKTDKFISGWHSSHNVYDYSTNVKAFAFMKGSLIPQGMGAYTRK